MIVSKDEIIEFFVKEFDVRQKMGIEHKLRFSVGRADLKVWISAGSEWYILVYLLTTGDMIGKYASPFSVGHVISEIYDRSVQAHCFERMIRGEDVPQMSGDEDDD